MTGRAIGTALLVAAETPSPLGLEQTIESSVAACVDSTITATISAP